MRKRIWMIFLLWLINGVVLGLLAFAFLVHRPITSWSIPRYASPYRFYAQDKLFVTWNYSRGRRLQVWNVETGLQLADLAVKAHLMNPQISFSADGSTMAWVEQSHGADELRYMKFHDHQLNGIVQSTPSRPETESPAINPLLNSDGSKLAYYHLNPGCLGIWDTAANQPLLTYGDDHFTTICSIDGKRLLTWSRAGNVPGDSQLWDFNTGKRLLDLEATPVGYTVVRDFSPDNQSVLGLQYLYRGDGWNEIVKLKWDLVDGRKTELWKKSLNNTHHRVDCHDARIFMLYESTASATVQIIDSETAKLLGSFDEHLLDETLPDQKRPRYAGTPGPQTLFGVRRDGRLADSCDQRYLVSAYEFRDQTRAWWRQLFSHVNLSRLIPPATGIKIKVIDLKSLQQEFVYDLTPGHVNSGHRIAFAERSNRLAVAKDDGNNNTLEIWEIPRRLQWGSFLLSTLVFGLLWYLIHRSRLYGLLTQRIHHHKT